MFRLFSRTFCTNSRVKFHRCSKDISAAIAYRVQEEERAESVLPKIYRGYNAKSATQHKFGDFVQECLSVWEWTDNSANEKDIDKKILQPFGVPTVFESQTRQSESCAFEELHPYGFGAQCTFHHISI